MPGFHPYLRGALWWCQFTVAGKSYRVPTGKRDRGEAEEAAATLYLEARRRARVPIPEDEAGRLELTKIASLYLADLKRRLEKNVLDRGPRYYDNEESALAHTLEHFTRAGAVDTDSWNDARDKMRENGTSSRTIQRVTVATRHLLRYARALGAIRNVPTLEAPPGEEVEKEQAELRPMTARERNLFLRLCKAKDRRAWRIYTALFFSNLRKSGLERLRVRDARNEYAQLPPRRTKNRKRGELWLHPKVRAVIREELRDRKVIDPGEPIFGPFDFRELFWEVVAEAKIDPHGLTPHHVTRRTASTIAGDEGATLNELMAMGQWTTAAMAMRYVRINAKRSKRALERL